MNAPKPDDYWENLANLLAVLCAIVIVCLILVCGGFFVYKLMPEVFSLFK